jgi:hypothetical protein
MEKFLISLNLISLNASELVIKAGKIATGMETNSAKLPNIYPTSAEIRTEAQAMSLLLEREANLLTELSGLRQQLKMKSSAVSSMLKSVGSQVESLSNSTHDPSLIEGVGFDLRDPRKAITHELSTPINVRLTEIPQTSGALHLLFKAVQHARSYGIIWAYGNTSPEAWHDMPMKIVASSRSNKLKLDAGKTVWVRVKAYGPNNTESDWSDVAMRIVP